MLKRILDKDDQLSPEDKEQLEMMIAQRHELEHEITARWQADAKSTWLASNVRPLIVLILVATLLLFITLDSMDLAFTIRDAGLLVRGADPDRRRWLLHPALCGGQETEAMTKVKPISQRPLIRHP